MIFARPQPSDASPGESAEVTAAALQLLEPTLSRRRAPDLHCNIDEAQELVQDTCLKAIRARDRFARRTNLKAWLYTT